MHKEQDIMKNLDAFDAIANLSRRALGPILALAVLLLPAVGAAAENKSGWSINFTPVLLLADDHYRFGGGADPELKYSLDLGGARLSAGARVGGYYAKNLFGVTVMPTLRLTVPVGPVEPYVAFGMGYGWITTVGHGDFATMSRLGVVFRFSKRFAIGVEGTLQKLDGSNFRFPSFGSMVSFDL
jgi:hypothetical protein